MFSIVNREISVHFTLFDNKSARTLGKCKGLEFTAEHNTLILIEGRFIYLR